MSETAQMMTVILPSRRDVTPEQFHEAWNEYYKEYYRMHRDKLCQRSADYYAKTKAIRIKCPDCGIEVMKKCYAGHLKTQRHQMAIEMREIQNRKHPTGI